MNQQYPRSTREVTGVYGGFIPTRDFFGHQRYSEIPFLNRDIIQTTTRPQIGNGTRKEISNQTLLEGIIRPVPTTTGAKSTKWLEPKYPIGLDYLPYNPIVPGGDLRATYWDYYPRQNRDRLAYYTT